MVDKFKTLFYLVLLGLVAYNIYTGATIQKIGIPGLFEITFRENTASPENPSNDPAPASGDLPAKYFMDNNSSRVIIVKHLGGDQYRIEEPSSPWPWEGIATLDGGRLTGDFKVTNSLATFRLEGVVRGDQSVDIDYMFITEGNGESSNGRVDHHIWYPAP